MARPRASRRAFTILELLVVVFLIALLAILAVTQFLKSSEVARADQAINFIQQIAAAQHMYTLSQSQAAANAAIGQITNTCNDNLGCSTSNTNPQCNLVRCSFLSKRDWDQFGYAVFALNPSDSSLDAATCGFPMPAGANNPVACAKRKTCGAGVTGSCVPSGSRFATWGYVIDSTGQLFAIGGAVAEENATVVSPPPH